MTRLAYYFAASLFLSLLLNPLYRRTAVRFGYLQQAREDRWHAKPTAAVGGWVIATTVLIGFVMVTPLQALWLPLACIGAIFVLGATDDIRPLKATSKLVVQIMLASVILFFGYRLGWTESLTLDTLLTLAWIVGITNAFNLLDNMDGLCGGIALIAGGALLAGVVATGTLPEAAYLAVLLGAVAGFLVYNVYPATIFLGDSGSLLIGLSLALLPLHSGGGTPGASLISVIAAPILVLLIPIVDTVFVTTCRLLSGRSPARGGTDHSSHRLVAIGLTERRAVAVLWTIAAVSGLLGFSLDRFPEPWTLVTAALFLLAVIIFAVYLAQVRVYQDLDPSLVGTGKVTLLVTDFLYKRRVAEIMLDVGLVSVAYYAAYRLRFEGNALSTFFPGFLQTLPLVLGVQMLTLFAVGGYRGRWRHYGLMDGVVFAKGVLLGTLAIVFSLTYLYRFESYSRAVFVIYAALLVVLLIASRASFRLIDEFIQRQRHSGDRLVIYGAGRGGAVAVREMVDLSRGHSETTRLVGFIDDDPNKHGTRFLGYMVRGGFDQLVRLIEDEAVDTVVVSTRLIDGARLRELSTLCSDRGVALSRLNVDVKSIVAPSLAPKPVGQLQTRGEDASGARVVTRM